MPPGPSPAFDANNAGMSTYGPAFGASSPVLNKGVDATGRARRPKRKKPLDPTAAVMLQMEGAPFWTTWRDQPVIQVTSTHAQGHSLDGWKGMLSRDSGKHGDASMWLIPSLSPSFPPPLLPTLLPSLPPVFVSLPSTTAALLLLQVLDPSCCQPPQPRVLPPPLPPPLHRHPRQGEAKRPHLRGILGSDRAAALDRERIGLCSSHSRDANQDLDGAEGMEEGGGWGRGRGGGRGGQTAL